MCWFKFYFMMRLVLGNLRLQIIDEQLCINWILKSTNATENYL